MTAVSPSPPWADELSLAQEKASCAAQQIGARSRLLRPPKLTQERTFRELRIAPISRSARAIANIGELKRLGEGLAFPELGDLATTANATNWLNAATTLLTIAMYFRSSEGARRCPSLSNCRNCVH